RFRDAQNLRGYIAANKHMDSAEAIYEAGDFAKAKSMVLDVLAMPDLPRDEVREMRQRLERWAIVVRDVEDGCCSPSPSGAEKCFRQAVVADGSATSAWRSLAQARIDELAALTGMDCVSARDRADTALAENRPGAALIDLRWAKLHRDARLDLVEISQQVAEADTKCRWAAALSDFKGAEIRRAELLEAATLLRDFLPPDDPRRELAASFLEARAKERK